MEAELSQKQSIIRITSGINMNQFLVYYPL